MLYILKGAAMRCAPDEQAQIMETAVVSDQ